MFDSALIVEDLDEPRHWLVEVLRRALPQLRRVDAAADLAEARALVRQRHYGLAVVDWSLPDGDAHGLIVQLARTLPPTLVVVATIHDDDAHVFPALLAGASGYVLKSQPRTVVEAQLQRIAHGEPPLSPSIALRILSHFRLRVGAQPAEPAPRSNGPGGVANTVNEPVHLSVREAEVLAHLGQGHKAAEIGRQLGISVNTVNGYVREIYRKLNIGSRAEAALEATRRGLLG
jgi:DNA-binding NarL/FixJ family response regulator